MVRIYVAPDGTVVRAAISKSAGDAALDEAARTATLQWKMNPAAIKPVYPNEVAGNASIFARKRPSRPVIAIGKAISELPKCEDLDLCSVSRVS